MQLFVGNEVLNANETDITSSHQHMYVRHKTFIQARHHLTLCSCALHRICNQCCAGWRSASLSASHLSLSTVPVCSEARQDVSIDPFNCTRVVGCSNCAIDCMASCSLSHHGVALLQGQAPLDQRLTFQPASLSTGFHKRLTAMADKRHTKASRVQHTTTVRDPMHERAAREKQEEERIRAKEALERKQVASLPSATICAGELMSQAGSLPA